MLFYTHIIFSVFLFVIIRNYYTLTNELLFLSSLILFTLLPDIDSSKSYLGKKLGLFSKLINFFFGHRTLFHSYLFILPTYFVLSFVSETLALGFFIGTTSHLLLDSLTKSGIQPLYPLKYRIKGSLKTGNVGEYIFLLIIIVVLFFFL